MSFDGVRAATEFGYARKSMITHTHTHRHIIHMYVCPNQNSVDIVRAVRRVYLVELI